MAAAKKSPAVVRFRHNVTGVVVTVRDGFIPDGFSPEKAAPKDDGGYSSLKVADLTAEIAKRNEGREESDRIQSGSGTKADLIAALEADDLK
jgi:hypothetical protein